MLIVLVSNKTIEFPRWFQDKNAKAVQEYEKMAQFGFDRMDYRKVCFSSDFLLASMLLFVSCYSIVNAISSWGDV